MYLQTDVILRSSVHAPGYPATNIIYNPDAATDGYVDNYFIRGPQFGSSTEFHEQGHAYRFPRFANTNEAEVHLHYVAMANQVFGMDLGEAFFRAAPPGGLITENQIDYTATFWMASFSFAPRDGTMGSWEAAYQVPGYARYVDYVRLFGWEGLGNYWKSFNDDLENGTPEPSSNDDKLVRLCEKSGVDASPLWHFWGIVPNDIDTVISAIQELGIEPSGEIYALLKT